MPNSFFRWATLKEALVEKRSKLGESQNLQTFIRDVDDVEGWISEKMQTALEESFKDPTNIQVGKIFMSALSDQRTLYFIMA